MQQRYDQIKIRDLEVFANHGVFPEENTLGQKFLVSATLYTHTRTAGLTDDLTASIHYGEVSAFIDRYLREHTFRLLERAAEALAEELLLNTPRLEKLRLEIKKPWAPVRLPLKTVSVEIERGVVTKKCRITVVETNKKFTKLRVVLTEGKNREIRKMFEVIGKEVAFLKRLKIGELTLTGLDRGAVRKLSQEEVFYLKNL